MTLPLAPGDTLGIIGGGQLGRMLSQAASRLGLNVEPLALVDLYPAIGTGDLFHSGADVIDSAKRALQRAMAIKTAEFKRHRATNAA